MVNYFSSLHAIASNFNGLALRQLILLFVALLSLVYMVWYVLLGEPLIRSIEKASKLNASLKSQYSSAVYANSHEDLDVLNELQSRLDLLNIEHDRLNQSLSNYFSVITSSTKMLEGVKGLLKNSDGLRIEHLEEMPAERLYIPQN